MTAFDFFGNEIHIGDTVAFMRVKYRNLQTGTVKSITPKKLVIGHVPLTHASDTETVQFHNQVIVKR